MSDSVETALARTLTEAAEAAPEPPSNLIHAVDSGFRRRRRRRYSLIAGIAAFAVITGSAIWAGNTFRPQPDREREPVLEPAPPAPLAELGTGRPDLIAKVWPGAYRTIPARFPDGRKFRPEELVDDRLLLAVTEASFENANEIWLIDIHTGRSRLLTQLPKPHPDRAAFASHFTVGSGHVVWWDSYRAAGGERTRIWRVPVAGGQPSLVTTVFGGFGTMSDQLRVYEDAVYFSDSREGGVWKVPVTGGDAELVPGTDGQRIVSLPWAGQPAGCGPPGMMVVCPDAPERQRMFTELHNVATGARRTMTLPWPDAEYVQCAVSYCVAATSDHKFAVFTRDGRRSEVVPGFGSILRDRFLLRVSHREGPVLYDLRTGRYGAFQRVRNSGGPLPWDPDSRMIFWPVDKNRSYAILNLAAIE